MKEKKTDMKNAICLIAYFSRPGKNYVGGTIVDLPVGNTEVIAKMIQEITGGYLFRIEPVKAYPEDYTETTEVAKKELQAKARPKLTGRAENMDAYNLILLGYPNWWGTMPMPVFTFLEGQNLSGKTIAPFCTHEGSGTGHSITDIRKTCPGATVIEGLAIRGGDVRNAKYTVAAWLQNSGISMKT